MKKIIALLFLTFTTSLFAQNWNYNFDKAKEIAKKENKNIVMVFSGSDWCAPCIRLDKNIWQSEEFKQEADKNWVLVKLNFPRKKANQLSEEQTEHNRKLAEKYNKEGSFPLVILMQPDGKVIGKLGFKNVSATEYIEMIKSLEK